MIFHRCSRRDRPSRRTGWANSPLPTGSNKKADVMEYRRVFHYVGLLYIQPPVQNGVPFI